MIRACVIGLGERGRSILYGILLKQKDVQIVSVCDVYEDRVSNTLEYLKGKGIDAAGFTNYKEALNIDGIDAAYIFSGWADHADMAIYAMERGIAVACEVGCEYSIENCFNLVRTQERTGAPYMLMENCCWGKKELLATALVRKNKLGTIVHCSGAYAHDLRNEVAYGLTNRHYRFRNYQHRCCENYPTHELGPIAKILDINRGNRILSVSSFATKAVGLKEYIASREDATDEMKNTDFKQGDIVTTVLTCANGETILLRLDTTLPRSYSRELIVRGTKGMYTQDTHNVFLDGDEEEWSMVDHLKKTLNNAENLETEYLPDIWKSITQEEIDAGHGGMDWFAYNAFLDCLQQGKPMPVDVYDAVTWMAIGALSEISIQQGGAPQAMPDFTNGKWFTRPRLDVCEF